MIFTGGQRLNDLPVKQKPNSWRHTKNMLFKQGWKSPSNEPGFDLHITSVNGSPATVLPKKVMGVIKTHTKAIYLSTDGQHSEIGINEDGAYRTILLGTDNSDPNNDLLNFSLYRPIEGVFKINYKGEIIIAWCDGVEDDSNTPKVLNIDNLPFSVTSFVLDTPLQANLLQMFPECSVPKFDLTSVEESGGFIKAAAYFFTVAYEIDDIDIISPVGISNTVYINSPSIDTYNKATSAAPTQISYNKAKAGELTSRCIRLSLSNLDTRFKYFRLIAIRRVNGQYEFIEVGKLSTGNGSVAFTYTGQDTGAFYSEDTVIIPKDNYFRFKSLTSLNDELVAINVRSNTAISYQKYANNIAATWVKQTCPSPNGTIELMADSYNTFYFKTLMPEEVNALYIFFYLKDGTTSPAFHIPGRAVREITVGAFTFFENALLSSIDASLTSAEELNINTNVKFFHTRDTSTYTGVSGANYFGYWENETELYPDTDDFDIWDAGGATGNTLRNQKVRHHKSPGYDTLYDVTDLPTTIIGVRLDNIYIPPEIEDKVQAFGLMYAERGSNLENMTVLGISPIHKQGGGGLQDKYSRAFDFALMTEKPAVNPRYLKRYYQTTSALAITGFGTPQTNFQIIEDTEYHPADNVLTVPANDNDPEVMSMRTTANSAFGTGDTSTTWNICGICNYVPNAFENFYNQKLAMTGKIVLTEGVNFYSAYETYGFDIYLNALLTLWTDFSAGSDRYHILTLTYCRYNIAWREKDKFTFNEYDWGLPYIYNKDFSALADIKTAFAFDPYNTPTDDMPYRVPRSIPNQSETTRLGWRTWPNGRYFEMAKNKGVGWKVQGLDQSLVIHMEHTTFLAVTKDKLASEIQEVFLGIGDIFDRNPTDLLPVPEGYAGCQSQWGNLVCKLGYVFADRKNGKIFVLNKTLEEISKEGMREFFRDFLNTSEDVDNPFHLQGITMAYDEKFDRLIVSKKDYNGRFGRAEFLLPIEYAFYTSQIVITGTGAGTFTVLDGLYYTQAAFMAEYIPALNAILNPLEYNADFDGQTIRIFSLKADGSFPNTFTLSWEQLEFYSHGATAEGEVFNNTGRDVRGTSNKYFYILDRVLNTFKIYTTPTFTVDTVISFVTFTAGVTNDTVRKAITNAYEGYCAIVSNFYIEDVISFALSPIPAIPAVLSDDDYTFASNFGSGTEQHILYNKTSGEIEAWTQAVGTMNTPSISSVPISEDVTDIHPVHQGATETWAVACSNSSLIFIIKLTNAGVLTVTEVDLVASFSVIKSVLAPVFSGAQFIFCFSAINTLTGNACIVKYNAQTQTILNQVDLDVTPADASELGLIGQYSNIDQTTTVYIGYSDSIANGMYAIRFSDFKLMADKYPTYGYRTTAVNHTAIARSDATIDLTSNPRVLIYNRKTTGGVEAGLEGITYRTFSYTKEVEIQPLPFPFTISFSPALNEGKGGWFGLHDYLPNFIYSNRAGLFSIFNTNQEVYKHNSLTKVGIYYNGITYPSYIELVFNMEETESKEFISLSWLSNVRDLADTKFIMEKTATHAIVYDENRCSGLITLIPKPGTWFFDNARNVEETWNYNNFRDMVKDNSLPFFDYKRDLIAANISANKAWFKQNKFIGKFVIVRFIYDNSVQNSFYLHDAIANAVQSIR